MHDLKSCCGRTSSILVTSHQNEAQTKVLAHVPLILPNPAQLQPSYPCMGFSPFKFYQNTRDTKKKKRQQYKYKYFQVHNRYGCDQKSYYNL
jgi:hypothetical protein